MVTTMKPWLLSLLALAGAIPACADKPATAIVVAIQPEMPTPAEVDGLDIEVQRGSNFPFVKPYDLDPTTRLPGTLTLTDDEGDPKLPLTITIRARKQGKEVILRRATLGFSEEKTKLLRMPLRYGCWGFPDSCPSGQSCKAGECASDEVDPETLPVFLSAQVFGTRNTGCFDATACMASATDVPLATLATCTFSVGGAGSKLNLALKWSRSAGTAATIVDEDADEGWVREGDSVRLSSGICAAVKRGEVTRAGWSGACEPKQPLQPACPDGASGGSFGGSGGATGGVPPAGGSGGGTSGGEVTGGSAGVGAGSPPKGGSGGTSGGSLPGGGSGGTSGGSLPNAGAGGA